MGFQDRTNGLLGMDGERINFTSLGRGCGGPKMMSNWSILPSMYVTIKFLGKNSFLGYASNWPDRRRNPRLSVQAGSGET